MYSVIERLKKLNDPSYRVFTARLIPSNNIDNIIGVRSKDVRKIADELYDTQEGRIFMDSLPHKYHDENMVHAELISKENKDLEVAVKKIERFFPYVDNWAVCDTLSIKVFAKFPEALFEKAKEWLKGSIWESRFALIVLMKHFLKENYSIKVIDVALSVKTGDYYVDMGLAWFLSYALVFRYDDAVKYLEGRCLPKSIHTKTIQKAVDSFRISPEKKIYLKSLR